MPSDDPLDAYRTDWERRKAISNKYGRPFYAGAALSLILYIFIELGLPESPNAQTGRLIFRILHIGRTYGHVPVFVYGTRWEQWLAMSSGGLGIACLLAAAIVYYRYNPGALYRGVNSQMRE